MVWSYYLLPFSGRRAATLFINSSSAGVIAVILASSLSEGFSPAVSLKLLKACTSLASIALANMAAIKASCFVAPASSPNALYCGAGTIGLSMAKDAENIIGVEIIPEAIKDAKFNAKANNIDNAEFICGDASAAAKQLSDRNIKPDVVIVDPPRKGCSEELIKTISGDFCPEKVVYVSCDPATLARDIKIFTESGYKLIEYTPVDLFPRTSHVETVALLVRAD